MIASSRFFETDFFQTNIEGSNCKKIPSEKIITRRSASSSNTSSSKGSLTGTPKNSLSICSKESPNNTLKSSPSPKDSLKNSLKSSPIAGLKRILSNSSTNVFKPIKFGSRKNISSTSSSPAEPSSPVKTPPKTTTSWQQITTADSIDQTIIDNNDLKKIFVRSYNIDVKNIDYLLDNSTMPLNRVNSIPKPPRISVDMEKENTDEIQALLLESRTGGASPQPNSPMPELGSNGRLITNDVK